VNARRGHPHRKPHGRTRRQPLPVPGVADPRGLDGIERGLRAPAATDAPYGDADVRLPTSLGEALQALQGDSTLVDAFGSAFIQYFTRIKQSELSRYELAEDKDDFQRREYFSRF
jgi:glutamine synthetase